VPKQSALGTLQLFRAGDVPSPSWEGRSIPIHNACKLFGPEVNRVVNSFGGSKLCWERFQACVQHGSGGGRFD
jgi:hypothetical protein